MKDKLIAEKFIKLVGSQKLWPPLFNCSPFIQGSGWNAKKYHGKYFSDKFKLHLTVIIDKNNSLVFLPENGVCLASSEFFQKYLKNPKILHEKSNYLTESIAKIDSLYQKIDYAFVRKTSIKSLLDICKKILHITWDTNAAMYFSIFFEKDFCWEEISKSKFKISQKEFNYVWDRAIIPTERSFDKHQLLHFLNLVIEKKNWAEIAEECQYMYSSYQDAKNLKEVERRLKKQYSRFYDQKIALKEILKIQEAGDKKTKNYKKWRSKLTKNQKIIADFIQTIIVIRDRRKNFFNKGITIWWRVAQKMFKEAGLTEKYIHYYTFQELEKGIAYLKKNKNLIKTRSKGFIILIPYNGRVIFQNLSKKSFKKSKQLLMDFYLKNYKTEKITQIKGSIGSPGVVRGIVKKVININDDLNFKKGNILVAGMTRPEFVPLMKKAAAIITNEGGITCHAAIVSRELGIPCVIGTKIATKVLKDGDLVEVDADKGIVKIKKSNK